MIGKTNSIMQSKKVRGLLWLLAALPMILVPAFTDGGKGAIGIGMMFLIFGIVTLSRGTLGHSDQKAI